MCDDLNKNASTEGRVVMDAWGDAIHGARNRTCPNCGKPIGVISSLPAAIQWVRSCNPQVMQEG